jgi:hypothetical protein
MELSLSTPTLLSEDLVLGRKTGIKVRADVQSLPLSSLARGVGKITSLLLSFWITALKK